MIRARSGLLKFPVANLNIKYKVFMLS